MNLQRFVPNFIKRLDHYLLTHYPTIWQSRIHNVIYATIVTNLMLGGLALLLPVNIGHRYDLWQWTWTFFVVAVTYLVIWIIHVGRFNIFKQYGKLPIGDEYLNFFLHMMCVLMIASTMFSFHYVYDQKIRNIVSNTELAQDINNLNLGAPFFPHQSTNYRVYTLEPGKKIEEDAICLYNYNNFNRFGTERFWREIEKIEDLDFYRGYYSDYSNNDFETAEISVEDTAYEEMEAVRCRQGQSRYGINCPEYSQNIFNKNRSRTEQLALITNYIVTAKKYGYTIEGDAEVFLKRFNKADNYKFDLNYNNEYQFENLSTRLENTIINVINSKTDRIIFHDPDFWHVMWYLSFYTTLLFMIYRNVRRKDFILSIVSGIVIMIVSGIIIALARLNSENEIFGFYFMIYCCLSLGATGIFFRKSHSWVNAAYLNLLVVATPLMPFFYYEFNQHGYDKETTFYWEMSGFVLFFLLIQLVFKKLYTRLWSLPER